MIEAGNSLAKTPPYVKRGNGFKDLTGNVFGRWIVVEEGSRGARNQVRWKCRCACGREAVVATTSLTSGNSKSCGCMSAEMASTRNSTHHKRNTPEFKAWSEMRQRCENRNNGAFRNYGGRGITVCDRWQTFEAFYLDMGPKPTADHSLDRFPDNDGNYEPGNCRWATSKQQARNRRSVRKLTTRGKTLILTEWSEISGVQPITIANRLKFGWSVERAIFQPARPIKRK